MKRALPFGRAAAVGPPAVGMARAQRLSANLAKGEQTGEEGIVVAERLESIDGGLADGLFDAAGLAGPLVRAGSIAVH